MLLNQMDIHKKKTESCPPSFNTLKKFNFRHISELKMKRQTKVLRRYVKYYQHYTGAGKKFKHNSYYPEHKGKS